MMNKYYYYYFTFNLIVFNFLKVKGDSLFFYRRGVVLYTTNNLITMTFLFIMKTNGFKAHIQFVLLQN